MADKTELDRMATDLAKADKELATKDGEIISLTKRVATLEADLRAREKDLTSLKTDLDREVAKNADPEEELLKGMAEPARRLFLAQKTENDRLRKRLDEEDAKSQEAAIAKQFDLDFGGLPVKGSDIAPVMKAITKAIDTDGMDILRAALKAGSDALKVVAKLQGMTQGASPTSTEAEVHKKATDLAAAQGLTYAKAYTKVLEADPTLYARIQAESGAQ